MFVNDGESTVSNLAVLDALSDMASADTSEALL